jgi:hypothetical protein
VTTAVGKVVIQTVAELLNLRLVYVDGAPLAYPINLVINFTVALSFAFIIFVLACIRYYRFRRVLAYRRTLTGRSCRDLDMTGVTGMYPPAKINVMRSAMSGMSGTEVRRRKPTKTKKAKIKSREPPMELSKHA